MRSLRLLAATTVILFGAAACGDNGGGTGINQDPEASFSGGPCTVGVACAFTDTSTDPEGTNTITLREWNFGDGSPVVQTPSHIYEVAGTYTVTLTVTDNGGNTDVATQSVIVNGGTTNQPPVAGFTVPTACVAGADCLFTDTSTDDAPPLTGWSWNFGDPNSGTENTSTVQNPTHRFSAEGQYQVSLTVTDAQGLTNAITQTVTIAPPTGLSCTGTSLTEVTCTITLAQRSSVAITLESEDCEIGGNTVFIPPPEPRAQSVFFNVCNQPTPQTRPLRDDAGAELVFEANTQLPIVFRRGSDPVAGPPQAQLTNTSASTWSISIDDGGNPGGPGEPDFGDVVLTVTATAR